jgi:NADP-dependent 3-hydroxy acid dehydrogenase YdfG
VDSRKLAATAIALNDVHSLGLTGRFDRMTAPVCPIAGVGPGTDSALAKRFSEGGYRVALLARSEEHLATLENSFQTPKDSYAMCPIPLRSRR